MKKKTAKIKLDGLLGTCGDRTVFLGFAPASLLYRISFSDVLNEDTGEGYQRQHNRWQSLDFKKYITQLRSSTIPLVFNLRTENQNGWKIIDDGNSHASLHLDKNIHSLAQVDCQHRLGELYDQDISLAFMTFIGLDLRSEMAMFSVINSKARGLCSSLTDYHESNLLDDIRNEAPHLFIARKLNEDPGSPWYKLIRYGGETTSGIKRRTSLRMMQKSIDRFLKRVINIDLGTIEDKYGIVVTYWNAVRKVFPDEWRNYRSHLITKGLGLYSLMLLLSDIINNVPLELISEDYFVEKLLPLKNSIDWNSKGMFSEVGGQKGATEVYKKLKELLSL